MTLTDAEVDRALAATDWRRSGDALVRDVHLRDFESALRFVEDLAAAAVDYGRRPDMCITEFNRVRLMVANPHHAGFTQAELRLIEKVDAYLAATPHGTER
jgi:pterin-4a-carbinolamine dehydratase